MQRIIPVLLATALLWACSDDSDTPNTAAGSMDAGVADTNTANSDDTSTANADSSNPDTTGHDTPEDT